MAVSVETRYPESPGAAFEDRRSILSLLKRLTDDVTTLFRKEIALAQSETSDALDRAKTGASAMAVGGAVLFAGLIYILGAAVAGLAEVMEVWLASLIVGAVVALIGYVMLQRGKARIEPAAMKPERTAAALRKDRDMITDKDITHRRTP
jgi:hypothetical protein